MGGEGSNKNSADDPSDSIEASRFLQVSKYNQFNPLFLSKIRKNLWIERMTI